MSFKKGFYDKVRDSLQLSSARSFYLIVFYAIMKNFAYGWLSMEIDLISISTIFIIVFIFSLFLKLLESKKDISDLNFAQNH